MSMMHLRTNVCSNDGDDVHQAALELWKAEIADVKLYDRPPTQWVSTWVTSAPFPEMKQRMTQLVEWGIMCADHVLAS